MGNEENSMEERRMRRQLLDLPFEARPTEIPPNSPRALDALERARHFLADLEQIAKRRR